MHHPLLRGIAADDDVDTVMVRKVVATLVGVLLAYYELHSLMFGTTIA